MEPSAGAVANGSEYFWRSIACCVSESGSRLGWWPSACKPVSRLVSCMPRTGPARGCTRGLFTSCAVAGLVLVRVLSSLRIPPRRIAQHFSGPGGPPSSGPSVSFASCLVCHGPPRGPVFSLPLSSCRLSRVHRHLRLHASIGSRCSLFRLPSSDWTHTRYLPS